MDFQEQAIKSKSPVWGLAATLLWGVVIAVAFVFTQLIVMGVYVGLAYGDQLQNVEQLLLQVQNDGFVVSMTTISTFVVCGLMIVGIVKLKKGARLQDYLGLHTVSLITLRNWGFILVALIAVSDLLTVLQGKPIVPEFVLTMYQTTRPLWLLWIAFIIAAPVFEEFFFRGFLFAGFMNSFPGPAGAVLVTSVLWSVIHFQYDLYGVITIFVLGLVLGYARYSSGSVLLTTGMHAFANFVATIQVSLFYG